MHADLPAQQPQRGRLTALALAEYQQMWLLAEIQADGPKFVFAEADCHLRRDERACVGDRRVLDPGSAEVRRVVRNARRAHVPRWAPR